MSLREKVLAVFGFMRTKKPVLLDGFDFVDGLVDTKIRPVCAYVMIDGTREWCCWKCGEMGDLFSVETAVDMPRNAVGAWVRLHKSCA